MNYAIASNDTARVFALEEGIYACDATPLYLDCVIMGSLSVDRGDITKFECPSPREYGKFDEVLSIPGELSRYTSTLTTYMTRNSLSRLHRYFKDDCPIDLQLHFGLCTNPTDSTQYERVLILDDVRFTSWSTEELMALQSGDRAPIQETVDISFRDLLDVLPLKYSEVAVSTTVNGGFVSVVVADRRSCGSVCDDPSDGCQRVLAITDDGFLYYSLNGGASWAAEEVIDIVANPTRIPKSMFLINDVVFIVSDDNTLTYASYVDFTLDPAGTVWTTVVGAVDFAASDAALGDAFIVGDAGVVVMSDQSGTLTLVHDGDQTTENLISVDVHDSGIVLVGGANGALIVSSDSRTGTNWTLVDSPTTDDITAVLVKSDKSWYVGDASGNLYCTDNAGTTWTQVSYPGSAGATTPIVAMQYATPHIIYMIQNNRLLKSIAGNNFVVAPESSKKAFPTLTANALATCQDNVNMVVVVGEAAATGAIVLGTTD